MGDTAAKKVAKKKAKTKAKKKASKKRTTKKKVTTKAAAKKQTKKAATKKRATKKKTATKPSSEPITHRLTPQGRERRAQQRHDLPGMLEVRIELFGYQRDAREFGIGPTPDVNKKIQSPGTTVNLSLSGMLARIADPITEGSYCLVHFIDAGEGLRPDLRWGLAMRCDEIEPGVYEIAVRFNNPLEHLDVDALDAA